MFTNRGRVAAARARTEPRRPSSSASSHAMIAARTDEARVVGGGLFNAATDRVVDWAAWLCEYNHLAEPMPAGEDQVG